MRAIVLVLLWTAGGCAVIRSLEEESDADADADADADECDPLDQDCPGADACYITDEANLCGPPGTGTAGDFCEGQTDCAIGYGCVLYDPYQLCVQYCRFGGGEPSCDYLQCTSFDGEIGLCDG